MMVESRWRFYECDSLRSWVDIWGRKEETYLAKTERKVTEELCEPHKMEQTYIKLVGSLVFSADCFIFLFQDKSDFSMVKVSSSI